MQVAYYCNAVLQSQSWFQGHTLFHPTLALWGKWRPLSSFHLNCHIEGFHAQTRKLKHARALCTEPTKYDTTGEYCSVAFFLIVDSLLFPRCSQTKQCKGIDQQLSFEQSCPQTQYAKEERNGIVATNELAYTTLIYLKPFIFHRRTLCCRKPHLDKQVLKISIKDINPYVEDKRKQRLTKESQLTANPKFANLISVISRCT